MVQSNGSNFALRNGMLAYFAKLRHSENSESVDPTFNLRELVAEWPDHVAKKQDILRLIDRNSQPDFSPPSVVMQATSTTMLMEPAHPDEEQVDLQSPDDITQGSEPQSNPVSGKEESNASTHDAGSWEIDSLPVEVESFDAISKGSLITGKTSRVGVMPTAFMFLFGVITTVIVQLLWASITGKTV
ncbi:hypothetical protein B0T20DRAFT_418438 [Sordaria brevicollis]|uniref:Uncharacterized protein n=1 Tax=Sordaria brevicollis TaxID=83679 RepID=A0AAE0UAL4_SORBR|nr:hypothetical protein B0T20DRAFT_418438 [Sordaria brevicollis]